MNVITSLAAYEACVGEDFLLEAGAEANCALRLVAAEVVHDTSVQFAFTLSFHGPAVLLPQGTYALRHARLGRLDMFLVPVARRDDGGYSYEAVFNLLKELPSSMQQER